MTTKGFASTLRSNVEAEYPSRHPKRDVDNMFSTLKHRDSRFATEACSASALLQWRLFFFWTKILKIFNELLSKSYAGAMVICAWCFLKVFFLPFTLEILRVFWYWLLWIFWNFASKAQSCWFHLLYWYCSYALKTNALREETTVIRSRYRSANSWIRACVTHAWH